MAQFKKLTMLMPPPKKPRDAVGDWKQVGKRLGTQLPGDYRRFIETYGTGSVGGELTVYSPFSRNKFFDLWRGIESIAEIFQSFHDQDPKDFPHQPWPKPGGVIHWGMDGDGNDFFWLARGTPAKWPIVLSHHSSARMITFRNVGFVDFLIDLLSSKHAKLIWPGRYPAPHFYHPVEPTPGFKPSTWQP